MPGDWGKALEHIQVQAKKIIKVTKLGMGIVISATYQLCKCIIQLHAHYCMRLTNASKAHHGTKQHYV